MTSITISEKTMSEFKKARIELSAKKGKTIDVETFVLYLLGKKKI